jgi:hypothetical protein
MNIDIFGGNKKIEVGKIGKNSFEKNGEKDFGNFLNIGKNS